MKPHLRRGSPVGQYIRRQSSDLHGPIFICFCTLCSQSSDAIPCGASQFGRYFYSQYAVDDHLSENRLRSAHGPEEASTSLPPSSPLLALNPPAVEFDLPPSALASSVPIPETPKIPSSPTPVTPAPVSSSLDYEWSSLLRVKNHLDALVQNPLRFWNPAEIDFVDELPVQALEVYELSDLVTQNSSNSNFIGHVEWLQSAETMLYSLASCKGLSHSFAVQHELMKRGLQSESKAVRILLKEEWNKRRTLREAGKERIIPGATISCDVAPDEYIFFVILIVSAILHLVCNIARLPTTFLLGAMRLVCRLAGKPISEVDSHIPKDPRTVTERLNLHSKHTMFVCCPKCFKLYDLNQCPPTCTNRTAPESKCCDRRLIHGPRPSSSRPQIRPAQREGAPARMYLYQDFKHWLAWMHSRPDVEPYLQRPYSPDKPANGRITDIWESDFLRTFVGPDGKNLFLCPDDPSETRLVFNLNEDGFNPFGNRIAGKSASIGGLYLMCFNLPPSLRHKPENIFLVGIIPGPKEPSSHQINYILRPLVDDLQQLWNDGIFIAKTHLHPYGRTTRAALVALVCDMPAARLLGGFAHFMSDEHPCSMCKCKTSDFFNLHPESFQLRTNEEHREMAKAWLAEPNEDARQDIFEKTGVRWSELLRLEYWDPIQNTVIDPMHGFYLGIFQRHCRNIWGMNVELADSDGLWELPMASEEEKIAARYSFQHDLKTKFSKLPATAIRYLALQEGLDFRRKRKNLVAELLNLRETRGWPIPVPAQASVPVNPSANDAPSTSFATPTPLSSTSAVQRDAPADLPTAENVLLSGQPKNQIIRFSAETLKALADKYGLQVLTRGGKQSFDRSTLATALIAHRNQVQAENHSHAPANTAPTADNINKEEALHILRYASKTAINRLSGTKLTAVYLAACRLQREAMSNKDKGNARETSKAATPVDLPSEYADDETSSGSGSDESWDDDAGLEQLAQKTAAEMKHSIHKGRYRLGITSREGTVLNRKTSQKSAAVLGKKTLAEIRTDMERTRMPTAVSRAPNRPGEASHGKFSADQWRSFCTINLPITLIRLWGSQPEESRWYKMLVNFMHLVTAVRLANLRVVTEATIAEVEMHVQEYLVGLVGATPGTGLYPHTQISPYQHMILHFGSLLRRFGPVHSWRCFAFERLNYIMQNFPTNGRFGDLERTIFERFCMMQRLKSIFYKGGLPPEISSLIDLYQDSFESADSRGTRISDALAFEDPASEDVDMSSASLTQLDDEIFDKVQHVINSSSFPGEASRRVKFHSKIRRRDLLLSPVANDHASAQVVIFNNNGWLAAVIQRIFTATWISSGHKHQSTFALIIPYKPLNKGNGNSDPYSRFGFSGGKLFDAELDHSPLVVDVDLISSHFAYTPQDHSSVSSSSFHALPLTKFPDFGATPA